jgi:hypothetical protein
LLGLLRVALVLRLLIALADLLLGLLVALRSVLLLSVLLLSVALAGRLLRLRLLAGRGRWGRDQRGGQLHVEIARQVDRHLGKRGVGARHLAVVGVARGHVLGARVDIELELVLLGLQPHRGRLRQGDRPP